MSLTASLIDRLKARPAAKSLVYQAIDLPLVSQAYRRLYSAKIRHYLRTRPVRSLTIEPYNLCNLKCVMCPYQVMTRPRVKMGMDTFRGVVDQAAGLGITRINLTSYNEAFLDDLLFERIAYLKRLGMYVSFFSNGTVTNRDMVERLLACPPDLVVFSVDSADADTCRLIRPGAELDAVRENIALLLRRRGERGMCLPFVRINMTVMEANRGEIRDMARYWRGRCDRFEYYNADNRFGSPPPAGRWSRDGSIYAYPCWRAFYDWGVLSDGRVTVCECRDYDGRQLIGDVRTQGLRGILGSDAWREIRERHLEFRGTEIPLCRGCSWLHRSAFEWWQRE